jgi:NADH-quinone oxidoreductase subunit A
VDDAVLSTHQSVELPHHFVPLHATTVETTCDSDRRPGVSPRVVWSDARASQNVVGQQGVFGGSGKASLGSLAVSDFLRDYLTAVIFFAVAMGVVGGILGLGSLVRPTRVQPEKYLNYESGVDPVGFGWSQSQIRYYIFALLFVLFDVEAVFIFPWAIQLETYDVFGLVEMLVFIAVLALGLLYAWRKGVLRWV